MAKRIIKPGEVIPNILLISETLQTKLWAEKLILEFTVNPSFADSIDLTIDAPMIVPVGLDFTKSFTKKWSIYNILKTDVVIMQAQYTEDAEILGSVSSYLRAPIMNNKYLIVDCTPICDELNAAVETLESCEEEDGTYQHCVEMRDARQSLLEEIMGIASADNVLAVPILTYTEDEFYSALMRLVNGLISLDIYSLNDENGEVIEEDGEEPKEIVEVDIEEATEDVIVEEEPVGGNVEFYDERVTTMEVVEEVQETEEDDDGMIRLKVVDEEK